MTLYEAYSYLYDNRKAPGMKQRFNTAFHYWSNGTGPNEDAQRRHLLQAGFRWIDGSKQEWVKPFDGFLMLDVITIVIQANELKSVNWPIANRWTHYRVGDHFRVHIAGPKADLKKIQKKFGIPKKMK